LAEPSGLNLTQLSGEVVERGALRYTPARVAVIDFRMQHRSEQFEAGVVRKVECEIPCVALGVNANLIAAIKPGEQAQQLRVSGFLAARSLKHRTPVLHVNTIEFLEGN